MREARGSQDNKLELWGDAPRYEYSSVPLMNQDGTRPVKDARAGDRGHALMLNDKQVSRICIWVSAGTCNASAEADTYPRLGEECQLLQRHHRCQYHI